MGSLIVGVDLTPIKPIPRTVTFQSDITTDKCRSAIRSHLKTWKADTVLHDGAPNVGIAWVQDAFSQAELVLQALRLATEFLCAGGTFVTKVFRSKDYNALLWVLNQLFTKVEATKPPSSRNVSAEIFVVCRGFKAPKHIDPQFLDPRSVFAEVSGPTPNNEAKVFNPETKKRKRDGYIDGDYTQFNQASASEFIQTADPIAMLGFLNKLSFEQSKNGDIALATLERLPETSIEIRQCCNDLKVLGRKEFRMLLRWRLKARDIFGFSSKKQDLENLGSEEDVTVAPMDDELVMEEELQRLEEKRSSQLKRQRRRNNERKQREIFRMQMHMLPPTEIGLEQTGLDGEDSMFTLNPIQRASMNAEVINGQMIDPLLSAVDVTTITDSESVETTDMLDQELDRLYLKYRARKLESDVRYRSKLSRMEHADGEWSGFSAGEDDNDVVCNEYSGTSEDSADPIPLKNDSTRHRHRTAFTSKGMDLTKRASSYFQQDIFADIDGLEVGSNNNSAADMHIPSVASTIRFTPASIASEVGKHSSIPLNLFSESTASSSNIVTEEKDSRGNNIDQTHSEQWSPVFNPRGASGDSVDSPVISSAKEASGKPSNPCPI